MRYFRVKYGYGTQDQVSVPEEQVEKAIYAQLKGTPVQIGDAFVNGKNIISITPHWHRHTGWHDYYEPKDGDDWAQIKRDCPDYSGVLEHYKERVKYLISSGQEKQIGQGVEIPALDTPKEQQSEYAAQLADSMKIHD